MIPQIITPLMNNICDTAAANGTAGNILRAYSGIANAGNFYDQAGWWYESTVQGTIYSEIQNLGVANYFVLQEQPYGGPWGADRSDIMVVDGPNNERLAIEIKADFNQMSSQNDIDKLANILGNGDIDYGVAIFCSTAANFAGWLGNLTAYSANTTGGAIHVAGVHM